MRDPPWAHLGDNYHYNTQIALQHGSLTEGVSQSEAPAAECRGDDDEPEEVGGEGDTSQEGHQSVRIKHRRAALAVAVGGGAKQSGPLGEERGGGAGLVRHFDC